MDSFLSRLYESLRSLKLAILLILALALLSAIGGLLPQGAEVAVYEASFPAWLARPILALSLDRVFTSPLFLITAAIFGLNLSLCSYGRFLAQLSLPRKKRRHGPDLLHLGLILLLIGGTWSARSHSETSVTLSVGEEASLPGGELLRLGDFSFERYPDGRPRLWSSRIDLDAGGETRIKDFELRVNHPLRHGGYTLYQSGYSESSTLSLIRSGSLELPRTLAQGDRLPTEEGFVLFMAPDPGASDLDPAFVFLVEGKTGRKVLKAGLGEDLGPFTLIEQGKAYSSSIRVRRDPAFPLVLAGLLLVAFGTFFSYLIKLRELLR